MSNLDNFNKTVTDEERAALILKTKEKIAANKLSLQQRIDAVVERAQVFSDGPNFDVMNDHRRNRKWRGSKLA